MFLYDEKYDRLVRRLNGITFLCNEYKQEYDLLSEHISDVYEKQLPYIVDSIMPRLKAFYGEMRRDIDYSTVINSLGFPIIDVYMKTIEYSEASFDKGHTFTVSFTGDFDAFGPLSIDG